MAYGEFRSRVINKRHFSAFSSPPLVSFFFSCPLLSRETSRGEQSTATTWRWRQPRLFVALLLLPFREREVIAIATWTGCGTLPDRLSSPVGDYADPGATFSRKSFVDTAYLGNCPTLRALAGILPSAVSARRLMPNIDSPSAVSARARPTSTFRDAISHGLKLE